MLEWLSHWPFAPPGDMPIVLADPGTLIVTFLVQTALAIAASAIINAIFPTRIEGPRLSDLRIQTSTYGNAIPLLLGQAVRVAGNVIWSSGLQETATSESAKGGPEVTNYTYKVDCAIALGERPNGIAGILKIWGFGKLIYDATLATGDTDETDQGEFPFWDGQIASIAFLTLFGLPLPQKSLGTQAIFESITVYPGNFTQMPDPTMEAALGVGNVPAYRGTAYVVIKGLQLADFGNVLPNLEFLVIPNPDETVRTAVETIVERAGISEDQYNFDCLTDPQPGYVVGRVMPAQHALAPLTFAHNFDIVDDAGNLRGIERDEEIIAIISNDDLAGHSFGEERPDPIQWERAPVVQLPREVSVTFSDPARDFQENSMTARRSEGTADSNMSIELAMTLDATTARGLADRALWEAWLASQMAKIQSTDRLIDMKVGRAYLFDTPAGYEALRVFSKTRGRNGVIEWELRRERSETYSSPSTGTSGTIPVQQIPIPGPTELILLDMPIMRDVDDNSGFYFAVVGSQTGWRGSAVMRAISASEDFITFQSAGVQSVVGDIVGTVGDGPTELEFGEGTFDNTTVINIELRHGGMTLESVSNDAIAAGANYAFIGNPADTTDGEVIQFGSVELQSGNIWRLSHLKRGKRGTEFATSLHGSGEIFVLLQNTGATMRADFGVPDLNLQRLYKAVSLLLNPDDVDHTFFTNTGVGLRPYSPKNLDIQADTVGDLVLAWERRSRLDSGILGEAAELYIVRIMDVTNTTVIRETQVTEQSFTYTDDMQIADFGAVQTHLCWRVAQVSAVYGNGIFAESCGPVVASSGGSEEEELSRFAPQGRLTLTSAVPVLTADVTAAGTVYYTPYVGDFVPIYNGSAWVRTEFAELSQALSDSTKSPAAAVNNSNYDLFVWNDAGTIRCTRGPAWTSDTGRGTGAGTTELLRLNGIWVNTVAITNGPAANRGIYVGTIRTNGSATVDMIFGGTGAAGGESCILGIWNAYNRVSTKLLNFDNTDSWTYTTDSWRVKNNNTGNNIRAVIGLSEDAIALDNIMYSSNTNASVRRNISIGFNSTTAYDPTKTTADWAIQVATGQARHHARMVIIAPLGFTTYSPIEASQAVGTTTWYGDNAAAATAAMISHFIAIVPA